MSFIALHARHHQEARPRLSLGAAAALFGAALLGVLGLPACSDDHGHGRKGVATNAVCPASSTLTFANFGQPFMQAYCLRCHGSVVTGAARMNAPADHNFDNAVDIGLLADHIDEYAGSGPAATNTVMPPSDPRPTVAERTQLSEWLACGAP